MRLREKGERACFDKLSMRRGEREKRRRREKGDGEKKATGRKGDKVRKGEGEKVMDKKF